MNPKICTQKKLLLGHCLTVADCLHLSPAVFCVPEVAGTFSVDDFAGDYLLFEPVPVALEDSFRGVAAPVADDVSVSGFALIADEKFVVGVVFLFSEFFVSHC